MGYRSNFLLTAKPMTEDLYQRISDELKHYVPFIMCECMEDGAGVWLNEDDTWYSCQSDMIQLSKDFPDTFLNCLLKVKITTMTGEPIFPMVSIR